METFMLIVKYAWGPLVGAVIGYFTNYIAVKMLFHPHKPWMIGKFRVPFTPGIVPRRQPELAKAIGDAVGNHLFTGNDLKELLLAEESKDKIVDIAMDALDLSLAFKESDKPLQTTNQLVSAYLSEDQIAGAKEGLTNFLTDRIMDALDHMNLGAIIAEQGAAVLGEKKGALGMLSMFVNEHTIQGFMPQIADKLNTYIAENGKEMVRGAVLHQIEQYSDRPLHDLMVYTSEEQIRAVIGVIYEKLIAGIGDRFTEVLDISSAVERKVAAMSVKETEALCMKVMKRELNTIVNLGGLIGFILGLFNLLSL